jgi:hypothetical protein
MTIDTQQLEAVARAIHAADKTTKWTWTGVDRRHYEQLARAAIGAIPPPSADPTAQTSADDAALVGRLRTLAAKATPGPWHVNTGAIGVNPWIECSNGTKSSGDYVRGGCILNMVAHDENDDDAALIAALRNNLPEIITALSQPVPSEATEAMIEAGKKTANRFGIYLNPLVLVAIYRAMLTAGESSDGQ